MINKVESTSSSMVYFFYNYKIDLNGFEKRLLSYFFGIMLSYFWSTSETTFYMTLHRF